LNGDEVSEAGRPLPRIAACRTAGEFGLEVLWSAGGVELVDVSEVIGTHPAFASLRSEPALFAAARVTQDGDAVGWPDGSELSAVWIERMAEEMADPKGVSPSMR
jgi:hypothetical protein